MLLERTYIMPYIILLCPKLKINTFNSNKQDSFIFIYFWDKCINKEDLISPLSLIHWMLRVSKQVYFSQFLQLFLLNLFYIATCELYLDNKLVGVRIAFKIWFWSHFCPLQLNQCFKIVRYFSLEGHIILCIRVSDWKWAGMKS